jgi:hypothetical protein
MTPVLILGQEDEVLSGDFCRPLNIDATGSSCNAEGYPKNFVKWVKVSLVIPTYFCGLKVKSLWEEGYKFEFVRGELPDAHKLDMRLYPTKAPKKETTCLM